MLTKVRDPISGFTHMAGALLSIAGLVVLVCFAAINATAWHIVSFSIFGASLVLLYTASTLYHLLPFSARGTAILRRIDHMMIYVLIAGTYTPVCLVPLRGAWGWSLLGGIWAIAIVGIILKGFWMNAPRWLSTLFYMGMGWLVVIAFWPLVNSIPSGAVWWLVAGGLMYTIGAVIYATKWPRIASKLFGFHEIFHLFVMAGSLCHFWFMLRYILYIG